jgi:hypothetical protein
MLLTRVRRLEEEFRCKQERGLVPEAVLVITPKFALLLEQQVVSGGANWVRFSRLKNSILNSGVPSNW